MRGYESGFCLWLEILESAGHNSSFPLHLFAGYLQCLDLQTAETVTRCSEYICILSSSKQVLVLEPGKVPPPGCAVAIASDKCIVHLLLKVLKNKQGAQNVDRQWRTSGVLSFGVQVSFFPKERQGILNIGGLPVTVNS